MLKLSHGLVLFTGPTGSGKSTSLYATMESIKSQERKIITLEETQGSLCKEPIPRG